MQALENHEDLREDGFNTSTNQQTANWQETGTSQQASPPNTITASLNRGHSVASSLQRLIESNRANSIVSTQEMAKSIAQALQHSHNYNNNQPNNPF